MQLVLASASPRRRELLGLITPDFEVCTADVEESGVSAESPKQLAEQLAQLKCRAVSGMMPQKTVIGCDTVVDVDGEVFGKPRDRAHAREMLRRLSGRSHWVHTGVCVRKGECETLFAESTRVEFAALSDAEIEAYLDTPDPYDKAGAYGIQSGAARFVKGIEGCYFNVVGLPVYRLYRVLFCG